MGKEKIETVFVDANIFLEVELSDERSAECRELFSKIHKSQLNALTSDFVVYTCLLQLERKSSVERMQDFAVFLDNINIRVHPQDYQTIYSSFETMKRHGLDFDDALVISVMRSEGVEKLISFDKDFDKVKEIKRIEPRNVI